MNKENSGLPPYLPVEGFTLYKTTVLEIKS